MGRETLLESLRGAAAEDRAALWRDARAAADQYAAELDRAFASERARLQQELATLTQNLTHEANAEAQRRRRATDARDALALANRCRMLAEAELPRLRAAYGPPLFLALAAELPGLEWRRITVNPSDLETAQHVFPGAVVVGDANVRGGLTAETSDGRVRVSNTLETRLALAWPDLALTLVGRRAPDGDHGTIAG
jgi:hypothetical protein